MKHFFFILMLSFLSVIDISATNDWGQKGHRTTGEIAYKYLKNKVKRKINKLLKGESLAYVSTYADEIKSDRERFRKYYTWHYVNMPLDATYETSKKNPKGDLITGITHCIAVLKDKNSSQDDKRFFLKLLVHFLGDLHQPFHVGLAEDWGGNKIQVQWHKHGTNIHHVWDDDLLDTWDMGYKELAENEKELTKSEIKELQEGTLVDWLHDTHKLTKKVYTTVQKGDKLSYRYSYNWMPTVRNQLQKGGVRLAKILNDIFG